MKKNTFAVRSKTIGILLFATGMALVVGAHYGGFKTHMVTLVLYATMLVGLVMFFAGMANSFFSQVKKQTSIHHDDGTVAAMALIRCMIAICIADDHLDEREIKMIAKIYKQLMGNEMDEETIVNAAEDMQREETDITSELASINNTLYDELRTKILKASLYILAADGIVDKREEDMLEEIRKGLGYSRGKLQRAKEKFLSERGLLSASPDSEGGGEEEKSESEGT